MRPLLDYEYSVRNQLCNNLLQRKRSKLVPLEVCPGNSGLTFFQETYFLENTFDNWWDDRNVT